MARQIVFYSWQSDRPNNTNRGLIQTALERAAAAIRKDQSLQIEPVIERDTAGVAGTPDIAATIFEKIDTADVFVADATLVTEDTAGRPSPNPNVLIELGYAVKALTWHRIVLVMNTHFGGPESLPFDLRTRRVIAYNAPSDDDERRRASREQLQRNIEGSLRDIIEKHGPPTSGQPIQPASLADLAIEAITDQRLDRGPRIRRFVDWLIAELDRVAPDLSSPQWRDDELVQALGQSALVVGMFVKAARAAADTKDRESATSLHRAVELLGERQFLAHGYSGTFYEQQFDYWRFLTNEVFVALVAVFVSSDQLETALDIVKAPVAIPNMDGRQGILSLQALCQPVRTLIERNRLKRLNQVCVRADILKMRRDDTATALSPQRYRDGDLFVFCISDVSPEEAPRYPKWRPYSVMFGSGAPRFVISAVVKSRAERLVALFGIGVSEFQIRLRERMGNAVTIYGEGAIYVSHPLGGFDVNAIGSR